MGAQWMTFDFFTIISGLAIMIMAVALWKSIEYKAAVPGGAVGRTWTVLIALIALFFFGYLTLPLFILFPESWKDNIVAVLFFFGAVYVLVSLNLAFKIILSLKKD